MSEKMAPQFEVKPSKRSRGGVKYVTANGSLMNNKGEKDVKVRTMEGHKCVMKMQVTDVQGPLLIVSRICVTGHRMVLLRDRGYMEHEKTGQRREFARVDNVYRLRVQNEKGFSEAMNSESVQGDDVFPVSPCEEDEEMCSGGRWRLNERWSMMVRMRRSNAKRMKKEKLSDPTLCEIQEHLHQQR